MRVLIIPAAGLGSRLGASGPKLLHPVCGRPMIDHLLDLYQRVVSAIVIIVRPEDADAVRSHCAGAALPIRFASQTSPTGMLDALLVPRTIVAHLQPDHVWISWCDQVAVRPETVARLRQESEDASAPAMTFPTISRKAPYIHLERDAAGRIVHVRHRREGDPMPEIGEGDSGLFCLSRQTYLDCLPEFASGVEPGTTTRERNFLPFIPWIHARQHVRTFPCVDEREAIGINTREDLAIVEAFLCPAAAGRD
jgi:bifunctional UDP-N-acetylglucosamine pyrophosphorylase / glucosamine-1-phosphate N-acetyltransferase